MPFINSQVYKWVKEGRASDGISMEYYILHPNEAPSSLFPNELNFIHGYYLPEMELTLSKSMIPKKAQNTFHLKPLSMIENITYLGPRPKFYFFLFF